MHKTPNLQFLFIYHLPSSFLILFRSIYDLNVICAQSCGPQTSKSIWVAHKSQNKLTAPQFLRRMKKIHCIYVYLPYWEISQLFSPYSEISTQRNSAGAKNEGTMETAELRIPEYKYKGDKRACLLKSQNKDPA